MWWERCSKRHGCVSVVDHVTASKGGAREHDGQRLFPAEWMGRKREAVGSMAAAERPAFVARRWKRTRRRRRREESRG